MAIQTRTLFEISRAGHAALVRELGVVDTLRFLSQYTSGSGDYTAERGSWLDDEPLEDLFKEVREADRKRNA